MSDSAPTRQNWKLRRIAGATVLIVALIALMMWYLASARFQERMRLRVISQLQQMTGGRVELKSFRWKLSQLEFEARDLTIHGLEAPEQLPYAHVDRLLLRLKILSLFRRQVGISVLEVERPVVHIIVYPDGRINQPAPSGHGALSKTLFDLAIDRMDVNGGELLWNDQRVPLDFSAAGLVATMAYVTQEQAYDAHIQLAALDTRYGGVKAVHGKSDIQLRLAPGRIEFRSLKLVSDRSTLQAEGLLTDFHDPKIEFTYKGTLDLLEVGTLLRTPEMRRGSMELNGQGSYHAPDFTSSGRVIVKSLEWREASLRIPEATVGANYVLTRDRLLLSNITGQTLGGTIFGGAEIVNWQSVALHRNGRHGEPRQHGQLHVRISRMQVGALAAAVSTERLPLDRINPAGATSGTADIDWSGSFENAEARFMLDIEPPPHPTPGRLPITAHLQGEYHGSLGSFDITQLNIATGASRFSASGVLGSTTARLDVGLATTDIAELQPILAAFGQPRIPAEVHGRASFTGSVIGKLTGPTITGHLEVFDFDTVYAASPPPASTAASPAPVAQRMHWDSFTTDLVYTPQDLSMRHALLRRGSAQARFDANLGLHEGMVYDNSPFRARLTLRGADLQDLQSLFGTAYPITGNLALNLSAGGTTQNLNGQGALEVTGGTFEGEPFQSLRAAIKFQGREVQLNDIVLVHNGAQLTGQVAYNFGDASFHFDLTGKNFQLAKFPRLQRPQLSVVGVADFHLQGSGTTATPVINIELHARDLLLNKEQVGAFDLVGVTHGPDLHLSAKSHFESAQLSIDGDVRLRGDFPADVTLNFGHFDIEPLLRAYLQGRVTGHSSLAGAIHLRGPLLHPRDLNVTGQVDRFSAEVEKVTIESVGPIQVTLANEFLTLDQLHLKGFNRTHPGAPEQATTDVAAGGSIQLGGLHEMNFHAEGTIDFALLQSFNRDISSSGKMEVSLAVTGTMAQPETRGHVRISNGAISYIDLPNGLSNINGTLVFNENRLRVQSLTAQTGGGTLNLGGFINYSNGLSFNLTAQSRDIRLRYPPGVSASADADLRFSGSLKNSLLSGTVTINKFGVSPHFDLAYYLSRYAQTPSIPNPDSPLNNLHFDLHILSTQELQVEMSIAKLSGNADLRLRGTANHPVVLGRVDIAQGNVDIAGTKYHLERGDIVFNNPTTIAPVVDMEATARVRDYDISLGLHGPAAHPSINYRSDPPLPTADIIALLALGRTQEEALYYQTGPSQSLTELTSNAILEQALASAYSSRAQRLFGASRIKIDPQAGGAENNPNARVTIEQKVSDKVTLTFISNLSQSAQQIVQVEYNINRRLSVVAVRDQNGVLSFDVQYRQRKR